MDKQVYIGSSQDVFGDGDDTGEFNEDDDEVVKVGGANNPRIKKKTLSQISEIF